MEISTRHLGRGAHLLAYLPDPTYPPLVAQLRKILDGRSSRVPAMLERLRSVGVDMDIADVRRAPTARRRPAARTWRTRWSRWAWCRTERGVPAVPQPGPAGVRQPVRRPAGRDDPHRRGGRGSGRAGASVGSARPGLDAAGARSPSSPGSGWPASRSTTRTTAGGPRAAARDRAAARPRGHRLQRPPRPRASSITSWAATRPPPRSTSGWSLSPRPRRRGRPEPRPR